MNLLPNAVQLLKIIKKTALEAVTASKPMEICTGTVINVSPLTIETEQKMKLGTAQLILSRNVTDYKTFMTINSIKQEVTIDNKLVFGDMVLLLRKQGGQEYVVVDRLGVET